MTALLLFTVTLGLGVAGLGLAGRSARRRGLDRWIVPYLLRQPRMHGTNTPVHLLLCVADHYEPLRNGALLELGKERVAAWVTQYPALFSQFHDSDGRVPCHTFFYPVEEYDPQYLDALAGLCRGGYGEVEIHLHHDQDDAENLRRSLTEFKELLATRHGLLARDRETGEVAYGFIHGNWALDNSCPDGRWCGVNNELDVLRETGCYADFTYPSYPSPTQPRTINSIYYAQDDPIRPRSHDTGITVGASPRPADALMLIQGPLALDWSRRRLGVVPTVENGCLQGNQPPGGNRIDGWLKANVIVHNRPDWVFVKLHTHGAVETNMNALLGEPMLDLHRTLAHRAATDPNFHYHYVTARELYNLACAAEAGWTGTVDQARDFRLTTAWQIPALCLEHKD